MSLNILAIDTSGPSAGAAVLRDGEILSEIFLNNGLTHSQTIMPAAEDACAKAGLSPREIDVFACVVGPGSFTGVRIGACAVRGMAHAAGKKCASVDALEALAHGVFGFGGIVCPMLDARRDQVYCAAFRAGERPVRVLSDAAISIGEFFDKICEKLADGEQLLFVGEAAPIHAQEIKARFGDRAIIGPSHMLHVKPSAAADLAWRMDESEYVSPELLLPLYLRAPSAEREREAKLRMEAESKK